MNKYLLALTVIDALTGIIGFTVDFAATSFLRILFLVTADMLIILLLGKFWLFSQKEKVSRRRVVAE